MNCEKVLELMEEYIRGELEESLHKSVEEHILSCDTCKTEYRETKEIVEGLCKLKNSIKIKEDVFDMSKRSIVKKAEKRSRKPLRGYISGIAAAVFFVMFLFAGSVIAFPTFASSYMPELPMVKQLKEAQEESNAVRDEIEKVKQQNEQIMVENEEIKQENEELKSKLKEIGGSLITEYQTSEGIGEEDNNRIQEMAIAFIKAQYRGDIEAIKKVCTDELRNEIESNPGQYLLDDKGNVVFTQITNVAKEGDLYLVYVRLSDDSDISSYQINFEIVKKNGEFLVNFAGYDA